MSNTDWARVRMAEQITRQVFEAAMSDVSNMEKAAMKALQDAAAMKAKLAKAAEQDAKKAKKDQK